MTPRSSAIVLAAGLLGACTVSATRTPIDTDVVAAADVAASTAPAIVEPPPADRAAILAMVGEYEVSFDFRETVLLAEDYERRDGHRSAGFETVFVVEDEPGRIVLQHILVSRDGSHVTKHWRQDWLWQAPTRFEFTDEQTWRVRELSDDQRLGAWTQCVYEVNDAPRYCGTGPWNHRYGVATWTSDRSWRPLPRREHTKRSDYNALNVENRHTIVPGGWTHEQDNTKTRRDADGRSATLAREHGFNDYRRLAEDEFDFSPAYDYWARTADYWARVRDEWQARFDAGNGVRLDMEISGMPLIMATFQQADRAGQGEHVSDQELREAFDQYVNAPSAASLAGQ